MFALFRLSPNERRDAQFNRLSRLVPKDFRPGESIRFKDMSDNMWDEFLKWDEERMRSHDLTGLGFRTAVGSLMWIVLAVCPLCCASVMMLARFICYVLAPSVTVLLTTDACFAKWYVSLTFFCHL